jgi:hypothetical protein
VGVLFLPRHLLSVGINVPARQLRFFAVRKAFDQIAIGFAFINVFARRFVEVEHNSEFVVTIEPGVIHIIVSHAGVRYFAVAFPESPARVLGQGLSRAVCFLPCQKQRSPDHRRSSEALDHDSAESYSIEPILCCFGKLYYALVIARATGDSQG